MCVCATWGDQWVVVISKQTGTKTSVKCIEYVKKLTCVLVKIVEIILYPNVIELMLRILDSP